MIALNIKSLPVVFDVMWHDQKKYYLFQKKHFKSNTGNVMNVFLGESKPKPQKGHNNMISDKNQ